MRGPAVPRELHECHPTLGWALRPNTSRTSVRTGYKIDYQINSAGWRDSETTFERQDGVLRIVLVGDSRTFGFGVPIDKHFSKLIEGYLPNVEVINLGVGGYGVNQELITLKEYGLDYEPDLVVAYVAHYSGHRHMHTVRFKGEKPKFDLVNGKLVLTHSPIPESPRCDPPAVTQWMKRNSRVFRAILGIKDRFLGGLLTLRSRGISTLVSWLRPELVGPVSRVGRALPSADEHRQKTGTSRNPTRAHDGLFGGVSAGRGRSGSSRGARGLATVPLPAQALIGLEGFADVLENLLYGRRLDDKGDDPFPAHPKGAPQMHPCRVAARLRSGEFARPTP
jgi:hypothetical protein